MVRLPMAALAVALHVFGAAVAVAAAKGSVNILASAALELKPFQEDCDAEKEKQADVVAEEGSRSDDGAMAMSFLELNGKGFKLPSCEWTVFYDTWMPTFQKGEYEHPWKGGVHCLEACCRDPKCSSLQLRSDEVYQCYKYGTPPVMKGKQGQSLGDAHWLMHRKPAWSVFVKGTPAEVGARAALASEAKTAAGDYISVLSPTVSSGDVVPWLARIGVCVVLAALVVRILTETAVRAGARLRFAGAPACETTKLLGAIKK